MDIHQLELFLAVMDASSMTRAAEKFYLSPAAVSFQMHNLGLELNVELFVREGKKVNPTAAALRLADHARSILKPGQIKHEFNDDPTKDSRPFHFATGVTTLIYQLGKPLRLLRKQYPAAGIRVTVGVTEEIVTVLHERRFDLGLISLPVATHGLKIFPLFDKELLLLQPSSRRLSGGARNSAAKCVSWLTGSAFQPTKVPDPAHPGKTKNNPAIFGTFGNIAKNPFRLPRTADWDVQLSKYINFTERWKLQLPAEYFNVLNHPNFAPKTISTGAINGTDQISAFDKLNGNSAFGTFRAGQVADPRIAQFAVKAIF